MSKMTQHDIQCPNCGHTQETTVWNSINVSLDPGLKRKLYDAEINLFECQECKENTFINAPLLYHDMELKFCVQYYPPDELDEKDFFLQFNSDGSFNTEGRTFESFGAYIIKPHIVFDMNEMLRYIAFRDRVAAINKYRR